MLAHGVEDRRRAVHPHLVVVVLDRLEGERRPPRACRAHRNVLEPEHDTRPAPPFPEGRERPQQFALGTSRTLVDDDQIGIEAERGRAQDRPAHTLDLGIPEKGDAGPLAVAGGSIDPREPDVIDAVGQVERVQGRRSRDDDDRRTGERMLERLRHEERAPDAPQAQDVLRVEEDLGASLGRHLRGRRLLAGEAEETGPGSPLLDQAPGRRRRRGDARGVGDHAAPRCVVTSRRVRGNPPGRARSHPAGTTARCVKHSGPRPRPRRAGGRG